MDARRADGLRQGKADADKGEKRVEGRRQKPEGSRGRRKILSTFIFQNTQHPSILSVPFPEPVPVSYSLPSVQTPPPIINIITITNEPLFTSLPAAKERFGITVTMLGFGYRDAVIYESKPVVASLSCSWKQYGSHPNRFVCSPLLDPVQSVKRVDLSAITKGGVCA